MSERSTTKDQLPAAAEPEAEPLSPMVKRAAMRIALGFGPKGPSLGTGLAAYSQPPDATIN